MQSRGISLKSNVTFSVFYLIEVLIWRGTFCRKPYLNQISDSKVMSNWMILKTIENKSNSFVFLFVCCCFFGGGYISISHPDFGLISLDRNACYIFCPIFLLSASSCSWIRLQKLWHYHREKWQDNNGEFFLLLFCLLVCFVLFLFFVLFCFGVGCLFVFFLIFFFCFLSNRAN